MKILTGTDMTPEKLQEIRGMAAKFRAEIINLGKENTLISLRDFPAGSCGDATLLFARFLAEKGFGMGTYHCGSFGPQTHAWLVLAGITIDIATDAVPSLPAPAPVIVSHNSPWHERFSNRREPHDATIETNEHNK